MQYGYMVENIECSMLYRNNTPLFQYFQKLIRQGKLTEDNVYCDNNEIKEKPELQKLIAELKPGDAITMLEVVDLGNSIQEIAANVNAIQMRGATLNIIRCEFGFADLCAILPFANDLDHCLKERRRKQGYLTAKSKGTVGRKKKQPEEEQLFTLEQVKQVTGLMLTVLKQQSAK